MTRRRSPCQEPLVFWWPWSSTATIIGTNWHSCWQAEEKDGGFSARRPSFFSVVAWPWVDSQEGPVEGTCLLCVSGGDCWGWGRPLTPFTLQGTQEHEPRPGLPAIQRNHPSSRTFLTGAFSTGKTTFVHMELYPCHTRCNLSWVCLHTQMEGEGVFPPLWTQDQGRSLSKGTLTMHWVPWGATSPTPLSALRRWRTFWKSLKTAMSLLLFPADHSVGWNILHVQWMHSRWGLYEIRRAFA